MKHILMALSCVVLLAGCGGDGGGGNDNGGPFGTHGEASGEGNPIFNCNPQEVTDYNRVYYACENLQTPEQAVACKKEAQQFVDTYPALECLAETLDSQEVLTIRTTDIQNIIDILEENGI